MSATPSQLPVSSRLRHRLRQWTTWEYLPWWLANIPVYGFYGWFALRARHLFFFSNVNPAIPLGGAMGESKHDILQLLPAHLVPNTVFVPAGAGREDILKSVQAAGLVFPMIAKPDVGERGFLIRKLEQVDELLAHLERYPVDFLLQEFLDDPVEASVLFHRFPDGRFQITSVCVKEFLQVQGDGRSTVAELMAKETRAALQLDRFSALQPELLAQVPAEGAAVLLEPIGNHARGTKFVDANHLITDGMVDRFRKICAGIDGVLYGRFDLKTQSVDALQNGAFKVMELNGVLGEPAHIYDPGFGMWRAYRDLYRHWKILFQLHQAQNQQGIIATPRREALHMVREYLQYKKRLGA
jgi:hypothetical protein